MKFTRFAVIVTFTFLILNCSKSETLNRDQTTEQEPNSSTETEQPIETEDEIYFSYYPDPNELFAHWDDGWIILHNQNGELLDYRQFAIGDSLEFEGSAEMLLDVQSLSITILKHSLGEAGGHHHKLSTTVGIDKGTVWGWTVSDDTSIPLPHPTGINVQVGISVNNVPNVHWFDVSSLHQNHLAGHPFYQETNVLEVGGVRLFEGIRYILSLRDGNDEIKYQFLELPDPVSNLVLDYRDFLEYDQIIEVNLPEYKSYVARVSAADKSLNYNARILISDESSGNLPLSIAKLGYIDDYDTFLTNLVLHYDDQTIYNRYKIGEALTSINVPEDPQLQVEGNTIYDYSFSTNQNYYRNSSYWTFEDKEKDIITTYGIGGKTNNGALIGTLPDQLLERFPDLNLENLSRERTSLHISENIDYLSDDRQTISGLTSIKDIEYIRFNSID